MTGADSTCSPIRYWGFLPLNSDKNKIASAFPDNCFDDPGKIITGKFVFFLMKAIQLSKLLSCIRLPPTNIASKQLLLISTLLVFIKKSIMPSSPYCEVLFFEYTINGKPTYWGVWL